MVGLDKQPVDTDSSQASGLASRFQESMNVHRGTGGSNVFIVGETRFAIYRYGLNPLVTSLNVLTCA